MSLSCMTCWKKKKKKMKKNNNKNKNKKNKNKNKKRRMYRDSLENLGFKPKLVWLYSS